MADTQHTTTSTRSLTADPAHQAFIILRAAFTVGPIVFGVDKFLGLLVDWDRYLASSLADLSPFGIEQTMYLVGTVEIVAGIVVAIAPRLGAPVVSLWLLGIVANLLLIPGYYDIALRDVVLMLAAVSLWRLATVYDKWRLPFTRGGS
jgi:hypothetical protein